MKRVGFTDAGLDRADLLRVDEAALAGLKKDEKARLLRLEGFDPVLEQGGRIAWTGLGDQAGELIFLGLDGDTPLFAPIARAAPGQRGWDLFRLLSLMDARDAAIWGAARSLNEWHGRHPFCSLCGRPSQVFRAGWGRRCQACGGEHFPRVDPVVIMLAEHDGQVLVARQPQYPPERYSALAGFMEPGESIEEAVARELHEEAGIRVEEVRYVASQPWPFPGSLMIACLARALSPDLVIDHTELEHAKWVTRDQVAAALTGDPGAAFRAPPPYAIAHTLFRCWLEGRSNEE